MYKVIGIDKQIYGPVTADQLRQWVAEGRVDLATLVQAEGAVDWKPLSSFPEFGGAPQPITPPPVSMPPSRQDGTAENLALTGLILGILSIVISCLRVFGVLGVVFSIVALCREQPPGAPATASHKNMALAGLILSLIGLLWPGIVGGIFGAGALMRHRWGRW
jgi:hypothetical protein